MAAVLPIRLLLHHLYRSPCDFGRGLSVLPCIHYIAARVPFDAGRLCSAMRFARVAADRQRYSRPCMTHMEM